MKHACVGLRAVIGCSVFCSLSPAAAVPTPPPVSPSPTTRYEYDAMGHVTKILRGASGDSTSISYDSVYRVTSITDAKQGAIRFGYWGMTRYINKVTDPRGLETLYERTGLGHVAKIVSPDTGTTVFTYVPGTMLVETALDSRGVLTRYTYDAGAALTSVTRGQGGHTEPPTQFRYDEQGPGFTYTIGRLSSTSHAGGGSRYSYAPLGDLLTDMQFIDAARGANAATVTHTVRYGYASGGHVSGVVYPSGHKLHITLHRGDVTAMALAANESAEPSPLISAVKWAPFAMGIDGWQWHRSGGLVPHERAFDLSGRMVRYPIGQVLRDVRYDTQDRIAAFTHQQPDGTLQPALDQQFGYDEVDRLTSVVTAATSWSIAYDPNSNRASVSLDGIPSRYDTEPTSNRLGGVTNPARNLVHDDAGNTTSDSAGYTATYNLAGQLATLTKGGVTTTYTYNAMGQRIRKASTTGPQSTVIYVYDQQGQLLGEYDHEGKAIREYVWLQDVPIAVFMPNRADANGPPLVFHIHADRLNAPRALLDPDGVTRWLWLAEPFGTTAPVVDPGGRGPFVFSLRFPGQIADGESGLFYNWSRYYNATDGRYTQSDSIGLSGGINTYAYAGGNPTLFTDPTGEFFFIPALVGGGVGALSDLGLQLLLNGGRMKCVDWTQVGIAGAVGAVGGAWAGGAFRHSISGKSWLEASHRWPAVRGRYGRAQSLPPGKDVHHWLFPQNSGVARNFPGIANHPMNLNPTVPNSINRGLLNTMNPVSRTLYGSPGWARAAGGYAGAGVAMDAADECTCN